MMQLSSVLSDLFFGSSRRKNRRGGGSSSPFSLSSFFLLDLLKRDLVTRSEMRPNVVVETYSMCV